MIKTIVIEPEEVRELIDGALRIKYPEVNKHRLRLTMTNDLVLMVRYEESENAEDKKADKKDKEES